MKYLKFWMVLFFFKKVHFLSDCYFILVLLFLNSGLKNIFTPWCLFFFLLPLAASSPWAREHGDAQMTGRATACGPTAPLLSYTAPLPPMGVSSADSPVAGVLFDGSGALFSSSMYGTVWCLDERSGAPRWSFHLDAAPLAGLALDTASATLFTGDSQGTLYAIDAVSGAARWRAQLGGGIQSTPSVNGALVLVGISGGASGGRIVAYNLSSGSVAWGAEVGPFDALFAPTLGSRMGGDSGGGCADAPTGCDTVFVSASAGSGSYVVALDAASGAQLWVANLAPEGVSVGTELSLGGGRLFFGGASGAVALDARTGALLWIAAPSNNTANPAIMGALVVSPGGDSVFFSEFLSGYFSLDAASGSVRWALPSMMASRAGLLDACGTLYFVDNLGQVLSINATTGASLWSFKTSASQPAPLGLSGNGRLAFVGGMGTAFVFGAGDGGGSGSGWGGGMAAAGAAALVFVAVAAAVYLRRRPRVASVPTASTMGLTPLASTASDKALLHRSIATSTADLQLSKDDVASSPTEPLLAQGRRADTIDSAVDVVLSGASGGFLASVPYEQGAPQWQQQLLRVPLMESGDSWVLQGRGGGYKGGDDGGGAR